MKDVVSCEKPRGGATTVDPGISEWGNPAGVMSRHPMPKLRLRILSMGGEVGELKHLSSRTEERKLDSLSSGERNGKIAQTQGLRILGVVGPGIKPN
jgi:hypothetical protein